MIYNKDYDRWVSKDGLIYRYSKRLDKLILCSPCEINGYERITIKGKHYRVHRIVYETFVNKISEGYQIDHINTIRNDNRLENLRLVTQKENNNNPITREHLRVSHLNNGYRLGEFGKKFIEHYGIKPKDNVKLYKKESNYFRKNGKCSWE